MAADIYTLGHSTRSWEEFLGIIKAYEIQAIADVRAFPTSTRSPHFARDRLREALPREGIEYYWLGEGLGGYRKEGLGPASPNKAWESPGFRNYADHMLTQEFLKAANYLVEIAERKRTAVLCAERLWWRCHRRLLSDWLLAQGHRVTHIIEPGQAREHQFPPFARVEGRSVTYPGSPTKP